MRVIRGSHGFLMPGRLSRFFGSSRLSWISSSFDSGAYANASARPNRISE